MVHTTTRDITEVAAIIDSVLDDLSVIDPSSIFLLERSGGKLSTGPSAYIDRRFGSPRDLIAEIVVNHAIAAERLTIGTARAVIEGCKNIRRADDKCISAQSRQVISGQRDIFNANVNDVSFSSLRLLLGKHVRDQSIIDVFIETLKQAGIVTRITLEKGTTDSVEITNGYEFQMKPAWPMNAIVTRPLVAVFDGVFEFVHNIDAFLNATIAEGGPVVIFCRGLGADVLQTLRHNVNEGRLNVYPIIIPGDLENINTHVDLSVVTGSSLMTTLLGSDHDSLTVANCVRCSRVHITDSRVLIINDSTKQSVDTHRKHLVEKLSDDSIIHDVSKLLTKRIRSLSSKNVVIRIKDDTRYIMRASQFDTCIRCLKSAMTFGISDAGDITIADTVVNHYATECSRVLQNIGAIVSLTGSFQDA